MAKKTIAQKEPVKLREKKLSNGNISLYLDIYRNGKRHKEYLKLYLIEAKTPIEREQIISCFVGANSSSCKQGSRRSSRSVLSSTTLICLRIYRISESA